MFFNKIINCLKRTPTSYAEKHSAYKNSGSRIGKYIPGFVPSRIKPIQVFPDNRKLNREKWFTLNGDASNLRLVGKVWVTMGNMWTSGVLTVVRLGLPFSMA